MNKFYKISCFLVYFLVLGYYSVNAEPIVNGEIVQIKHYPYQVYLSAFSTPTCFKDSWLVKLFPCILKKGLFCGGSIINKRYILTAAHCLENKKLHKVEIYAGTNKIGDPNAQVHTAQAFVTHPRYNKYMLKFMMNDIALIHLNEDIQFTELIRPVKLPKSDYEFNEGHVAVVTGWGGTNHDTVTLSKFLQASQQRVISWETCVKEWHTKLLTAIDAGMMCAVTNHDWPSGPCMGDSGGPFVDGKGYQIGITSFGYECGKTHELPEVYVNVMAYAKWIRENSII
ncbi:chymotrypsin-2-like [Trichogramma pretiosum]|uniref:chymotrypsin-2-like n=1 Tax=Trichogramma pretiosum TaxID=7493 RepID=UPI000C7195E7|nr:chymotrypsin-2-like [Trichogramma pretiosum]